MSVATLEFERPALEIEAKIAELKALSDDEAAQLCADIETRMGLPTVDPYRHGASRLVDALLAL